MKYLKLTLIPIFLLVVNGCSSMNNKSYLVSMYEMKEGRENKIISFYDKTSKILKSVDAKYLDYPLLIEKNLPNLAQPNHTESVKPKAILVAEFSSKDALDLYIKNQSVKIQMDLIGSDAIVETVFRASDFNPFGMMDGTEKLGTFKYRDKPAFIMLNNISMNSFFNPMTPYRIMKYMNNNFPNLNASNVRVIMPLEKEEDIRGHYGFEVLFMSEWESEKEFDRFHEKEEFIQLAKDTRNKAFSSFTESKARVLELDSSQ